MCFTLQNVNHAFLKFLHRDRDSIYCLPLPTEPLYQNKVSVSQISNSVVLIAVYFKLIDKTRKRTVGQRTIFLYLQGVSRFS